MLLGSARESSLGRQPGCTAPRAWRHAGRPAPACRSHDPMKLPSGALWWLREGGTRAQDWVFGEQFVLQRARRLSRTRMVRFTCRLCGTRNARWVNPLAWQRGSVFAQCRGCEVVHKLVDNLEIFDEAGHDVFPPPFLREAFLGKELLDRAHRIWNESLQN